MAEFVQTMKDWRRLCDAHTGDGDVCQRCPLGKVTNGCTAIYEDEMDYEGIEREVVRWAAEHPEPVYPSWYEYLTDMYPATWNMIKDKPIPADLAQKIGIEPKEE